MADIQDKPELPETERAETPKVSEDGVKKKPEASDDASYVFSDWALL